MGWYFWYQYIRISLIYILATATFTCHSCSTFQGSLFSICIPTKIMHKRWPFILKGNVSWKCISSLLLNHTNLNNGHFIFLLTFLFQMSVFLKMQSLPCYFILWYFSSNFPNLKLPAWQKQLYDILTDRVMQILVSRTSLCQEIPLRCKWLLFWFFL